MIKTIFQKQILAGVFFLVLAIVFFSPFLQGRLSFIWDTREFGYINLHQVTEAVSQGRFPLWNAYNFSGYPFSGDIESGMFYPVNWLFAWIFGAMKFSQLAYYFIFHFFLGGLLAYELCYKLTKHVWAALMGGVVFAYSGYALGHISHLGQVVMYMWLPGVFLAYIVALERRRIFYSLLAGFIFGMAVLVGHSNTTIYLLLGLFILTVFKMVAITQWRHYWWNTGLHSLLSTIFAFLMASILIFPVYELTVLSNRTDLSYDQQSQGWSLYPWDLLGMIDPNYNYVLSDQPMVDFNGSVDITQNYFYIGLFSLLLIIFGLFSKNHYKWYFVFLGLLTLFSAFGKYTPINLWLYTFFPGFNKVRMAVQIMGMYFFSVSVMTALGMAVLSSWIKNGILRKIWSVLAVIILVFIVSDIFYRGFDKRFYSEEISPEKVFDTNEDLTFIASFDSNEPFRVADEINGFLPNKYEYYGVRNVWGNGGIKIKKYNDLFVRMDRTHWLPVSDRLYNFLNVKHVFSDRPFGVDGFDDDNYRAYFFENFIIEQDEKKQLEMLNNSEVDFESQVMLREKPAHYFGEEVLVNDELGLTDSVKFLSWDPEYLKLETFSVKDAILVLSEVDYPGWKLYVDGKEEQYMVANYTFRAVPLRGGKHVVEFSYRPWSVFIGASISVFSFILLIMVSGLYFIKFRRQNG